jgi:hypothetical protein
MLVDDGVTGALPRRCFVYPCDVPSSPEIFHKYILCISPHGTVFEEYLVTKKHIAWADELEILAPVVNNT